MGALRGFTSGPNLSAAAQPIFAGTQDGDTLVLIVFRPASAVPTAAAPSFDFGSHYTSTVNPGARVARTTWNTGEATSYQSTNGTLGYVFLTFAGPTVIGAVQAAEGTTGPAAMPAVPLGVTDGTSRVFGITVHRDASGIDVPDGMTELLDFSPAANAALSLAATDGVTSYAGDASVPVTDAAGVAGWRSLAFEVRGAATPPPANQSRFFAFL